VLSGRIFARSTPAFVRNVNTVKNPFFPKKEGVQWPHVVKNTTNPEGQKEFFYEGKP
jgi:hypothetical protein